MPFLFTLNKSPIVLGTRLADAKSAVPPDRNASVAEAPFLLTRISNEGWRWTASDGNQYFEVATRDNVVAAAVYIQKDACATDIKALQDRLAKINSLAYRETAEDKVLVRRWESEASTLLLAKSKQISPSGLRSIALVLTGYRDLYRLSSWQEIPPPFLRHRARETADRVQVPMRPFGHRPS